MKWNQYNAKESILNLIKGKETSDTVVKSGTEGVTRVCKIKIFILANVYTKILPVTLEITNSKSMKTLRIWQLKIALIPYQMKISVSLREIKGPLK